MSVQSVQTAPDDAAADRTRLRHLVAGAFVDGTGERVVATNPARPDDVVATYRQAGTGELTAGVAAAVRARRPWADVGPVARGRVLGRAAELLAARVEQTALTMTREEGKTLAESRAEVGLCVDTLAYHAGRGRDPVGTVHPSTRPDELIRTTRRPLGVVGVVTPWNFPLQIPTWKIAPALLCGNTVVWKPAGHAVAVGTVLAEVLAEAGLPDGVLSMLLGPGSLGAELVAHPDVDGVTFTGSVPVGHAIRDVVVRRGAALQLELGGHNAALVLPDSDPTATAESVVAGAMSGTGQKCTATRRVIAVGDAHAALADALVDRVRRLRVGDGLDPDVEIGPLVSVRAADEVRAAVRTAVSQGAEILAEAPLPDRATDAHVAPTVLSGGPDLDIARNEVFGPVVLLMRAGTLDEAIRLANDTRFGLSAAVFTCDETAVRRCVDELDAGIVKANAPTTGSELHAPFGGLKDSTFPAPREQNAATAAEFFTRSTTAYLRPGTPREPAR